MIVEAMILLLKKELGTRSNRFSEALRDTVLAKVGIFHYTAQREETLLLLSACPLEATGWQAGQWPRR